MPILTVFGITLPTFQEFASSSGPYSSGFFSEMLPFAWLIIGFLVGAIMLRWLVDAIPAAFSRITGKTTRAHINEMGQIDYHAD